MSSRSRRIVAASLCLIVIAGLGPVTNALGAEQHRISHPWVTAPLADALAEHSVKIPVEFEERLRWRLPDGTLRVMIALTGRDANVEAFVARSTTWAQWYGDAPRFLGRVTQTQLVDLLEADFVAFVEPDYPITNFMSTSTIDVHARSIGNDGTGVWSYTPGPNGGSLVSDVPGLSVDQATGKGVTVAVTDSGIDKTHRDFGGWNCAAGPYQPCESRIRAAMTMDHIVGAGVEPGPMLPTTEAASGHGTHVAGTIAGNAYYSRFRSSPDTTTYAPDGHNFGIAPQASLISTKNGDSQSAGFSSFALQWQLDNADQLDIRVSSNSWGCLGGCSFNGNSSTARLLKDMYEAGIVVVFAAGNDGTGSNGLSNAQSPYALGVANYNDDNHRLASSSSRGTDNTLPNPSTWTPASEPVNGEPRPDVGAPGTGIWSARTLTGGTSAGAGRANLGDLATGSGGGTREYVQMTGTSMATPHVAGAAALLFSACPTATPLDVMRAVMAGADPTEVKSTDGSRTATPAEVGYGSLEIRRSVDWLLMQTVCGGPGGTDPTPDPTETATEPPPEPTGPPAPSATYYLHSDSGNNNVDRIARIFVGETAKFDTTVPTSQDDATAFETPLRNGNGFAIYDVAWTGTLGGTITDLTLDFWHRTPRNVAQQSSFGASIWVGNQEYVLPEFAVPASSQPARATHEYSGLNIPAGDEPVWFQIWAPFADDAGTHVLFDSASHPSAFSVNTKSGTTPDPTETTPQTVTTQVSFTDASADSAQYSDDATIEALLTTEDGQPIADAELAFTMTGAAGATREWTAVTDGAGVASQLLNFRDEPGVYDITVRYLGVEDTYAPDAEQSAFVVELDDSATTLDVVGRGNDRRLESTTTDADSAEGLGGVTVEFFADSRSIDTATTDEAGTAVIDLPPRYRYGPHDYEVVFAGDSYYERSSAQQQT